MKILNYKKEAFDASMPPEIKNFMQQSVNRTTNNANITRDFNPATAQWDKLTNLPISELRSKIKSKEYALFVIIDGRAIRVDYDPSNTTTSLSLTGNGARNYKDYSFTKLIKSASDVYGVATTNEIANLRNDRHNSRKGIISRTGQAQDPSYRSEFDGQEWKQDASGYWYDANRLARKLTDLNAEDSAAYVSNGADVFRKMVSMYTDHIKELASDDDIFNIDNALRKFTYEGQRLLSLASDKIRNIKYLAERAAKTLEDINSQRSADNKEPLSQEEYDEAISDMNEDLKQNWLKLRSLERQMRDMIDK